MGGFYNCEEINGLKRLDIIKMKKRTLFISQYTHNDGRIGQFRWNNCRRLQLGQTLILEFRQGKKKGDEILFDVDRMMNVPYGKTHTQSASKFNWGVIYKLNCVQAMINGIGPIVLAKSEDNGLIQFCNLGNCKLYD